METRAAVYRVRNDESGQAKFGHIWIKPHTKVMETITAKKLVSTGETLDGVWTVDWRDSASEYVNIFGEDMKPEIDVAADLRKRFIKPKVKGPKGMSTKAQGQLLKEQLRTWINSSSTTNTPAPACSTGDFCQGSFKYVDKGIEPLTASPTKNYEPPYTILYAPENP